MKDSIVVKLLENYKRKRRFTFVLFVTIYLLFISSGAIYYYLYKNEVTKNIDEKLSVAAKSVPFVLDEHFFERAIANHSITPQEDNQNIQKLSKVAKVTGVKYLYTMILKEHQIYFTSSSATDQELLNKDMTHYYDLYEEATEELKNIFEKNQIIYEESTDKWGTFRSILMPQVTKNGVRYIVGADIDKTAIIALVHRIFYIILIVEVVIGTVLLSLWFFLSRYFKEELRDIATVEMDLKQKTEHLQNSLANFKRIFNATMELIVLSDEEGTIIEVNQGGVELLGYESTSEIVGTNLKEYIYEADFMKVVESIQKDVTDSYEVRLLNKKGEIVYTLVRGRYIIIDDIKVRMSSAQDITNVKEKEAALKESKAKSEFLANMSHEIRTPLNAIMGFIDLLKEESKGRKKSSEYIEVIENASESLLQIIEDILDFSKIQSGKLEIDKHAFDTKKEFGVITSLFDAKSSQKDITLRLDIDTKLPEVLISDPLRIKQIIANLISNAVKFTPNGKTITVIINYKEGSLYVSVKDKGIGIEKDRLEHIFEAFTQADSSTTRKYGGTGLGLSISSHLVKLLGGKLEVKSEVGVGSEFYFSIPVKVGTVKENAQDDTQEVSFEGKKVLLVEDNKANQLFMKIVCKKLLLACDIANDGVEAVEKFQKNSYDFILMDENMPNMNGIEATKRILAIEKEQSLQHTPIIALTANAIKGDRERFLEAGMDEYLSKPVNQKTLSSMLMRFI